MLNAMALKMFCILNLFLSHFTDFDSITKKKNCVKKDKVINSAMICFSLVRLEMQDQVVCSALWDTVSHA